jgi:hypothetical protein
MEMMALQTLVLVEVQLIIPKRQAPARTAL